MSASIRARHEDGILVVELAHPSGFPRLTRALLVELHQNFDEFAAMTGARGAVLTGTAQCFAAGADLGEVAALTPLEALRFSRLGQGLMQKIERCAKPVIAAIRGHCLGGGLDLALACHLRVASTDALFRHPGASLGILTGWGGTARLPRLLGPGGRARVLEALTAGSEISPSKAYACGLVQRLVPSDQVLPSALELARKASCSNAFSYRCS